MRKKRIFNGKRKRSQEALGLPEPPKLRKKILGILSLCFGAFMVFGFIVSVRKDPAKADLVSDLVGLGLFGLVPILNGVFMLQKYYRDRRRALEARERALKAEKEREIIQLAQQQKGRLTLTEIVAGTSLDMAEAEKILQEMATRGHVDIQVTDSGVIVYEFYEIARGDKDSTRGLLE